jgi:hypothetical protein
MIRNKTIKFNLDKPEERELWEWLQTLSHGIFSEGTKNFWRAERANFTVKKTDGGGKEMNLVDKIVGKFQDEITVDILVNQVKLHIIEDSSSKGEAEILLWKDGVEKLILQLQTALDQMNQEKGENGK